MSWGMRITMMRMEYEGDEARVGFAKTIGMDEISGLG
jgi:hypothetical protein